MGNLLQYLHLLLLLATFGALFTSVSVEARDSEEEILVGRIAHVEGKLLRYVEEDKDWVVTVKDSPFGLEDALYSGADSKAEFIMPNQTWLRVGENTQLQLIALNADATTADVASGLARLYNKSEDAVIKVTTPFGYVVAPAETAFDLYVGDESLEVIAIRGTVDFVHDASSVRYEVREGTSSIIADEKETARGNGEVDSDWDDWNGERDEVWAERLQRSEYSAGFLPEAIREESHVFEENGHWERVNYEGEYRDMWRPTRVESGWRPFTAGRWTVYYGDNCWIPDESFGYVTHHYGSWLYVESARAWYWAPPAARFVADAPEFSVNFGWYPGRVGWIHSGSSIGWVPLAPNEAYYGYRPWGHHTVVVNRNSAINININLGRYRFIDEAVVVRRDNFYRGSRYTSVVERGINRDVIINNYRPTMVINNSIISNFNIDKRRFAYNDVEASRKPHAMVMDRINDNQRTSRGFDHVNRERIERDLTRFRAGSEPPVRVDMRKPMLATKIVAAENIAKPLHTLALPKKEIKPSDRERPIRLDNEQRSRLPERGRLGQPRDLPKQEEKGRIRSPRDSRNKEFEQTRRQQDPVQQPEGKLGRQEQRTIRQQQEEAQNPQGQPQQSEKLMMRKPQEGGLQPKQAPVQTDDGPRLRPPRDKGTHETGQSVISQGQVRLPDDAQLRQEQKKRHQQQEEAQGLQGHELQQQQQQEQKKKDNQRSQKQELQRQQQEGQQIRQKQEKQLQQQEAGKNLQEQQMQQRQQKEIQHRQEQEQQRKQQEGQQIRQQKHEKQRQQPEAAPQSQEKLDQQHALKKKKKKQQEEEVPQE